MDELQKNKEIYKNWLLVFSKCMLIIFDTLCNVGSELLIFIHQPIQLNIRVNIKHILLYIILVSVNHQLTKI